MSAMRGLLAAVLLTATTAAARPPLSFSLGLVNVRVSDRAYDLASTNDSLPLFRAGVGYLRPAGAGLLELDAAFLAGGSSADAFGRTTVELGLVGGELGAAYRHPVRPWLEPYGRLSVGVDAVTLGLTAPALEQRLASPVLTALAGTSLVFALQREPASPRFVLDLGLGYSLRSELDFDALGSADPDDEALAERPLPLGKLPLSGWTWRLQLGLRL